MADEASWEKFKACAVEVLQVPADKVVPEAKFGDDLDADSLDLVEFVMDLEEKFEITVAADTICVHSDTAGAVELATALRGALAEAGIACRPFVPGQ